MWKGSVTNFGARRIIWVNFLEICLKFKCIFIQANKHTFNRWSIWLWFAIQRAVWRPTRSQVL